MSNNANPLNTPQTPQLTPENKAKIKKVLPVAAIIVVLLILVSIFSSLFFGGGNATNKKALKLLQKQKPAKILSTMPDGFEEDVMDYYEAYVKDRKQLKDAIKQETASRFDELGDIKKVKILEKFEIDLKDLSGSGLNMTEEAVVKGLLTGIGAIWKEIKDCDEGYVTIVEITYKNKDGDKETEEDLLCSFKYDGKWYSMDSMSAVYHAAWGYSPSKRGK